MATAKKTDKKTTKAKSTKTKVKKKVGTKAVAKESEETKVEAKEPENEKVDKPKPEPTSKGGNGSSHKPHHKWQDGGWTSYELIAESTKRFKNPMGRDVTVRAELRIPDGRNFLRLAVGRVDDRSPIGLSRQVFFEDLPYCVEAIIDVYEKGKEKYIELETGRIRRSLERGLDGIEDVVSHNREDWSGRLLTVKKEMLDSLPEFD